MFTIHPSHQKSLSVYGFTFDESKMELVYSDNGEFVCSVNAKTSDELSSFFSVFFIGFYKGIFAERAYAHDLREQQENDRMEKLNSNIQNVEIAITQSKDFQKTAELFSQLSRLYAIKKYLS